MRRRFGGSLQAVHRAHDERDLLALVLKHGEIGGAVMGKGWIAILLRARQRHPCLDAIKLRPSLALLLGRAFGMDDAASRTHHIQLAGSNNLRAAQGIAMHDLPLEHIGHGRQADMGMGPDVEPLAQQKFSGTKLVEEDEWPDHLRLLRRQSPAHLHATKIAHARHDDMVDGRARSGRRRDIDGSGIGIHGAALLLGRKLSPLYLVPQACFAHCACANQPAHHAARGLCSA